ncbi:N-acylneuraminate cytidylyltransferase [Hydrogenispora ethanolica]|uniref:N-acylneuraminate cytidylyltransferase n=1 Tax=Hydrogenispora ethanolica TaxID=1082276 RepID=A0A4R1RTV4_HYDET|nr:acylneuraminate cytidylyltransferase family protein [Hydrogenispora ethanolica]TCL69971.1 N-acylneuraminate cytidylyltransferase [Hydrogenispora ethanolica]
MNILAIIPARGGSKGVPGKNIRLLGGYPLIAFSIAAAKLANDITRVVVSTDSAEIAAIAQSYGAETPFLRPAELARDQSADLEFMRHALEWFQKHEAKIPDYLVHLRPTTPLREPQVIEAAINRLLNHPEASSLRSAHLAPESPWKWFRLDELGYFRSFGGNIDNEVLNNPRQAFSDAYIPDGYVDVVIPALILSSGRLHGEKMLAFVSPNCTEVDTVSDFELLQYQLEKNGSVLWDYLKENYPKRGFV